MKKRLKKKFNKRIKKPLNQRKKKYLKKWKKFKKSKTIRNMYRKVFGLIGKLPKKEDIIVFESFLGKQYSCNPRAVYEELKQQDRNFTYYWSIDHRFRHYFEKHGVRTIHRFSLRWFIVMMRAKYWVFNSRLPKWIPKPVDTVYLQTWHGTPLKKLALDMEEVHMPGTTTEMYKKNFVAEAGRWSYLVAPNEYSAQIFERAFDFDQTMLKTGYPRNDYLFHYKQEDVDSIKERLGIPEGKKIILYAPTWRDNEYHFIGKYKFNVQLNMDKFKEELGDDYFLIFRLHYLVADHLDLRGWEDFAVDASRYEDIRDLYIVSDMLITDYSSVMFDYGVLQRPMLFYVYDIDSYRDTLRGFYFDFEKEAPGPLVKTTESLVEEIKNADTIRSRYAGHIRSFEDSFHALEDGNAARRVVSSVFPEE
ncbi:CDP-glycerol glycerophosphotransferase family protein [Salibacterium halotolerans]|uniref:CDP-glycerol glycerophosphotransferase n=1 Tax=Salibacterium halotolerans TaxID=1884432 RepID=A0A1I5TF68_9BACI|nr:CDP-glycerol glycerophosphotransferase family protein [Salibacterium halotolerans]SFP81689.1 CDP-glycerol glycerophosphotransferase [Salibacterium halotolerans]